MSAIKTYTEDDLVKILADMLGYAMNCNKEERWAYLKELSSCGLFHDAIGKVLDVTEDKVEITEEY